MGFRTVVMLNNDCTRDWKNDSDLGHKIALGMNHVNDPARGFADLGYGQVVECVHADTVTLCQLGLYSNFNPLAYGTFNNKSDDNEDTVRLLKDAADALGYRLVKK